jgi:hypothetical protein
LQTNIDKYYETPIGALQANEYHSKTLPGFKMRANHRKPFWELKGVLGCFIAKYRR